MMQAVDWLIDCSIVLLIDLLVGWLGCDLIDWLIDWSIRITLIDWTIARLIDWLMDKVFTIFSSGSRTGSIVSPTTSAGTDAADQSGWHGPIPPAPDERGISVADGGGRVHSQPWSRAGWSGLPRPVFFLGFLHAAGSVAPIYCQHDDDDDGATATTLATGAVGRWWVSSRADIFRIAFCHCVT